MSKQPSASGAASRVSRPVAWVRDLPIWTKLGLIMIVPTLATIIVGTVGLLAHVQEANNADRARTLAVLSGDAGALVHQLQDERALAGQLLAAGNNKDVDRLTADYKKAQESTDNAKQVYRLSRDTLPDAPPSLRALLDSIESQLGEMPVLREQVEDRTKINRSIAELRYRVLIADLLEIRTSAAQLTGDSTLTDRLRAAAAIATAKEFLSQERVVILEALADHELSEATRRDYVATRTGQDLASITFLTVATPEQQELFSRALTGPEMRETLVFEGGFDALAVGGDPNTVVSSDKWDSRMRGRAALMSTVENALNQQAQQAAVELGDRVQRQVLLETGLLLLTLLLGVLFAWLVARSMARSLRDLRQGALAVAQYGLPQAVQRLRDPALSNNASSSVIALQIAEPLPVRSKDEFGQVTEAFNAVHLEAVRTAAEQAALRASVATMFVNLARRSQILVDRLIGHLDRLERGEQDPDRLSELFQLDHLATRMRRNDENLLVLAGADSTRIQREPAALMDVLRAAQSEVEHYTRIEFGMIEPDIEIAAHAVNDMVHLVAELFDNATAYSPPDTSITVEARRVGDRAVLQVEDRGIGMSPDQYSELNERLATPPMVDVAVSRMMGLVVVARLAARHGVKAELRPARERGTVAELTLPTGVLVPRALAGRSQMPTGFPAAVRPPSMPAAPGARPAFPPPLALDSRPAAAPAWSGDAPAWSGPQAGSAPASAPAWGAAAEDPRTTSMWPPTPPPPPGPAPAAPFSAPAVPSYAGPPPGPFGGPPAPPVPPMPPVPPVPAPSFGAAAAGLGAALAGEGGWGSSSSAPASRSGTPQGSNGRSLPAWSDLTGASGQADGPGAPGATEDPLPQRRPLWGGEPEALEAGPSRGSFEPTSGFGPAAQPEPPRGPYVPPAPATSNFPPPAAPSVPMASRPPVWPPVAEESVPALPESLSSSLDMTSEIPRARGPVGGYGEPAPTPPSRYSDDLTMELPIFRELESAWFRSDSSEPTSGWTASSDGWSQEGAGSGTMVGSSAPAGGSSPWPARPGGTDGAGSGSGEVSWRSVADDGWLAAQAALEPQDGGTTDTGLPRRVPMAQLVPGGVDTASGGSDRRTPDSVRGLLSAYHRGVQRGRGAHGAEGSQTSGKEQEA